MTLRQSRTGMLVLSGLLAAMIAVCAQISLPVPPVPVSMALFAVLLCGAVLGPAWGTLSVCAYLVMGAIGLPVFSGFRGGPNVLFGPTGGYLVGYVLCAASVGRLAERVRHTPLKLFLCMAVCLPLCYIPGTLWMMTLTRADWLTAAVSGAALFLPGDLFKALLASLLAARLHKALRIAR